MDAVDQKIMNELLKDSRVPVREIGKKAGVSSVTVLKRMRKLEGDKVIKGYSANLDYDRLGYDLPVMIRVGISQGKLFEVEKKIAANRNVFAIYDVTGDFDALILARFRNRKSLDTFVKDLQSFEFVNKTETSVILNTIKEENLRIH